MLSKPQTFGNESKNKSSSFRKLRRKAPEANAGLGGGGSDGEPEISFAEGRRVGRWGNNGEPEISFTNRRRIRRWGGIVRTKETVLPDAKFVGSDYSVNILRSDADSPSEERLCQNLIESILLVQCKKIL